MILISSGKIQFLLIWQHFSCAFLLILELVNRFSQIWSHFWAHVLEHKLLTKVTFVDPHLILLLIQIIFLLQINGLLTALSFSFGQFFAFEFPLLGALAKFCGYHPIVSRVSSRFTVCWWLHSSPWLRLSSFKESFPINCHFSFNFHFHFHYHLHSNQLAQSSEIIVFVNQAHKPSPSTLLWLTELENPHSWTFFSVFSS